MSEESDKLDDALRSLGFVPEEVAVRGKVLVKCLIRNRRLEATIKSKDAELAKAKAALSAKNAELAALRGELESLKAKHFLEREAHDLISNELTKERRVYSEMKIELEDRAEKAEAALMDMSHHAATVFDLFQQTHKALSAKEREAEERKERMDKARAVVYASAADADRVNYPGLRDRLLAIASFDCLSYGPPVVPEPGEGGTR